MRNALNSTVTVVVEGNAGRYDWVKVWDNRFAKTFKLQQRHSPSGVARPLQHAERVHRADAGQPNGSDYLKPSTAVEQRGDSHGHPSGAHRADRLEVHVLTDTHGPRARHARGDPFQDRPARSFCGGIGRERRWEGLPGGRGGSSWRGRRCARSR